MSLTAFLFPSLLSGLSDVSVSPEVSVDNYPLIWNNSQGKWVASNVIAGISIRTGVGAGSQSIGSTANSTGSNWIAQGVNAGRSNTTGSNWIAQGVDAGYSNTTGSNWIAQGYEAAYFEERGSTWHVGISRSKSLVVGHFDTDCVYFGHAGPINNAATCPTPTAAVHCAASTTSRSSLRIDSGISPTSPNDGDIWFDGSTLKIRIAGVTKTFSLI